MTNPQAEIDRLKADLDAANQAIARLVAEKEAAWNADANHAVELAERQRLKTMLDEAVGALEAVAGMDFSNAYGSASEAKIGAGKNICWRALARIKAIEGEKT